MKNVVLFVLMILFLLAGIRGVLMEETSNEAIMLEFFFGFICGVAIWQNKQSRKRTIKE